MEHNFGNPLIVHRLIVGQNSIQSTESHVTISCKKKNSISYFVNFPNVN